MALKLAEGYVDIYINKVSFDSGLASVVAGLNRLSGLGAASVKLDTTAATAAIATIRQQLDALKQSATINVGVNQSAPVAATTRTARGGAISGVGPVAVGVASASNPVTRQTQTVIAQTIAQSTSQGVTQGVTQGTTRARDALGRFARTNVPAGPLGTFAAAGQARNAAGQFTGTAVPGGPAALGLTSDASGRFRDARGRFTSGGAGDGVRFPGDNTPDGRLSRGGFRAGGDFLSGAAQGVGLTGFSTGPAQMMGQMLGKAVSGSIGAAVGMETNMATLQRVSGLTVEDMKKFQKTIFDISTSQPGNSPQDVIDIATAGARAGVAEEGGLGSLEEFTQGITRIRGAVQGISTEQLADNLGRMVSLFGEGTDKIEGYGSALVHLDNISKSTASDILEISVGMAGTAANLKGLDPSKLMSLASVLKDVGVSNQLAVSTMEQILRLMGSKPENFAKQLGMPTEDFSAVYNKDAMKALDMVSDKFKEINAISPTAGQEWLSDLGFKGTRVAGVFQRLSTQLGNVETRAVAAREQTVKLTALAAAEKITGGTTESEVGKLAAAGSEASVAVGSKLMPAINGAAKIGTIGLRAVAAAVNDTELAPELRTMVRDDSGKMVPRTQENSMTGFLGLTMRPVMSAKEVKDQQILDAFNVRAEEARKAADYAESPRGLREKQLAEVDAERRAAQERSDRMAEERRAREEAHPGGLGLPGMGDYYQSLIAAQAAEAEKPDLVRFGRPGKQGRLNPFQSEQFVGPTGIADFGVGAIKDAIVGKKTDDMSKEQVERLDDIRTILTEIRDKKDPQRTLGTILRGAS